MYYKTSQKTKYALRALVELSLLPADKPVGVRKLSQLQDIPGRFLEVILNELRQGGFVLSVRGKYGGFLLSKDPEQITVGQIIRFLEFGPDSPETEQKDGWEGEQSAEQWLLDRVDLAIADIFDSVTLQEMVIQEQKNRGAYTSNYII